MQRRVVTGAAIVALTVVAVSCGGARAYRRGEAMTQAGDLDAAVAYYTKAVQADPDHPEYKIALERAMQAASRMHFDRARALEDKGELENAIAAYRKSIEYDPSNRQAVQRRGELERIVRERVEANRPRPKIDSMRDQARRQAEAPTLNPASKAPLRLSFNNVPLQEVLQFVASSTGINIILEQGVQQQAATRAVTLNVDGVTLEQALNLLMTANQLWYKVMNERTILVIQDTPQKRQQYEDQIIRTFYVSHAEPQELFTVVNQIMRLQVAVAPVIQVNKTANTITVRGTPNVVNIIEKIIQANDRPRAEIVVDVEILEVNRTRAKQLGINLSQYQIGAIFSPEAAPGAADDATQTQTAGVFNLNTITQGISTADFYLSVPQAIFRFLASDSHTRLIAKPQLRGAEGVDLELNLGDDIPVPQTVFGGFAPGGINTVPISSFTYRTVGVVVKMKPRVTFENEIVLDIEVESSTFSGTINVAGQDLPQFGTRKVRTRLRLREGESNLLAGLLREQDRRALTGVPGVLRVPLLQQLFGSTDESVSQTDIVMLLTPRIVRTHELTQEHLNPIYIGSQFNLGLTGPAPTIVPPPEPEPPQPPDAVPPGTQPPGTVPPGTVPPAAGAGVPPAATTPQTPSAPTSTPGLPPTPGPEPTPAQPPGPEAAAQVLVTTPGPEFRVGGGPYVVPISVTGASGLSLVSVSITYNPAVVRVRNVQEGTFLRQGGVTVTFTQNVDASAGRIDLSLARGGDQTGAFGAGQLAAIVVEGVAPGTNTFSISGVATGPDGRPVPLRFAPATVAVK